MAKKKSDKETEPKKVSTKRFSAFLKNETTHFVIGLISVIFAVYLLLAFTSSDLLYGGRRPKYFG